MILESSVTYLVVGKIIDHIWASQVTLVIKNLLKNAIDIRDAYLIPWLGRSPGGRKVNPLQYSCLENPMDRGAWRATVHRVSKSWTVLKQLEGEWDKGCLGNLIQPVNFKMPLTTEKRALGQGWFFDCSLR